MSFCEKLVLHKSKNRQNKQLHQLTLHQLDRLLNQPLMVVLLEPNIQVGKLLLLPLLLMVLIQLDKDQNHLLLLLLLNRLLQRLLQKLTQKLNEQNHKNKLRNKLFHRKQLLLSQLGKLAMGIDLHLDHEGHNLDLNLNLLNQPVQKLVRMDLSLQVDFQILNIRLLDPHILLPLLVLFMELQKLVGVQVLSLLLDHASVIIPMTIINRN